MHLSLNRSNILHAVQACQNIVERRHTIPILANVLIQAKDGCIEITATDLEVALQARTQAQVLEDGAVTVSSRKLFEILKELDPEAPIEFTSRDSFLHIQCQRSKFRLATLPVDEFPAIQKDQDGVEVRIDCMDLAEMVSSTSFAMSNDETRKYLTGTLFEVTPNGRFCLVATDGHRLALASASLGSGATPFRCIVPRKAVHEIRRLAENEKGQVSLRLGERMIRLDTPSRTLTSKLIDARFPKYEDVIPLQNPHVATVDRLAFDQVLRRAMIVANEFTHDVRLQFRKNELIVSAHNADQEEAVESIAIDYEGDDLEIGFNARYLRDALSVMEEEKAIMRLATPLSPVLIMEEGVDNKQFVVMPMRI